MSIRLKLTIMFLAIASIPLLLVSALTFTNYKNSLEANRFAQLRDLTIFRADRIETYFDGLKGHIEVSQGFYNIKKNLPILTRLADDPGNQEFLDAKKMLDAQLQQMQSVSDLSDIMLVNPQGRVVYANRPGHYLKDMSNGVDAEQKAFAEGKSRIYFSDVYFDKVEDNRFEMLLTAPAFDFNGAFIGVIAFEVDITPVYKLIQDTTGLGNTGEVLIGKKAGNQVEYLNPLRHDPNATLKRKIDIGDEIGRPMQEAVQGKTGSGLSTDYRGKKVIAAWRYIPSLDWGLVAKIDTEEAFADVTNLKNLAAIILIIVIVLSGITAFSIAHSISEPIKQLSEGAQIIGGGNLDYKIEISQKDEIGQLSKSFDKMTLDLKQTTASRDELNREIAERKQAQEAMLASETRYRRLFEAACDGILILDADSGQIDDVNPFIKDILGYSQGELLNKKLWEVGLFKDIAASKESFLELQTKGYVRYENMPLETKDGRHIAVEFVSNVYLVDHKKVIQCSIRDITDRARAEEALRKAHDELARSNKDLEQFAYVASHDLQEPLRAVSGFVELLRRNLEKALDAKTNEYMNFTIDGAKRMQSLIDGLLEYSRVGTQGKKPQRVNSKEVLDEALARLQAGIQESGAKITADDLPTVYFDDLQLARLFQNLIGNAIKFRGDQAPQIHVSAVRQDAGPERGGLCHWRFAVRDNGIGIEPQYAERIFMIFQRLHTRKAYPGTGIGLSICKKIVERHGGEIWVESAQEQGSTFYFTVPDIEGA